ncbi:hypothetical protein BDM02DRAFT_3119679, partial [Thelephora ganbajun]
MAPSFAVIRRSETETAFQAFRRELDRRRLIGFALELEFALVLVMVVEPSLLTSTFFHGHSVNVARIVSYNASD